MAKGNLHDLTGKHFGHLIVIERGEDAISPKGYHSPRWICQCDCGRQTLAYAKSLVAGKQLTCGRHHAYPEPDEKPKTPAHIKPRWISREGVWRFMAFAQTAPADKKHVQGATAYLGTFPTIKEGLAEIDAYYQAFNWHPVTKEESLRRMAKGHEDGKIDGVYLPIFESDKVRPDSGTGIRGVGIRKLKNGGEAIYAHITVEKKTYYEYGFKSLEEAAQGRKRLEKKHLPKKDN